MRDGDAVRVTTRRGSLTMPAQIDAKLMAGHVWMPNGFGMISADGVHDTARNQNELTDVDRPRPVHRHPAPPLRALPRRAYRGVTRRVSSLDGPPAKGDVGAA